MKQSTANKITSHSSAYDKMGPRSKLKVSSYTQVEPDMVRSETRSIVGQEDVKEDYILNREKDLSLRKQSKGERPPLVGQASSSSNDSVSFEGKNSDTEKENAGARYQPSLVESYVDTVHVDAGLGGINFTRGSYASTPYVGLLNRDEYINQRPPEGSSDQILGTNQPQDNQDFPRIRSASSASSVTSSKPLEWDSGADVGYNQIDIHTGISQNPGMSTIERMALACRTNLLTRSDPEGTTGPTGLQQPNLFKSLVQTKVNPMKNKLGCPNAESTPMCTSGPSDASPDTLSADLISPIPPNFAQKFDNVPSSSSSNSEVGENIGQNRIENNDTSTSSSYTKKSKIPLFPEIIESLPKPSHKEGRYDSLKNKHKSSGSSDEHHRESSVFLFSKEQTSNRVSGILDPVPKSQASSNKSFESDADIDISPSSRSLSIKKISSSLENISSNNNEPENIKYSNSLPRSRSQSNLQNNKLGVGVADSVVSNNGPKYNMALHSLIQNNKSASSSSIATVVHRKGESPKHKFAQTSAFLKESVGIQVSQCWAREDITQFKTATEMHFTETPHLPKPKQTIGNYPRSNYFDNIEDGNKQQAPSDELVVLYQRTKANEENKLKEDCPVHTHSGVPCTGAHRKGTNACRTEANIVQNPCCAPGEVLRFNSLNRQNRPVTQGSANANNKLLGLFGTSTIESVESSAKSGGGWVDKQYSVTVDDRANSFEYLPGHVYENAERQQPVDSHGTSSISIQNQTSNDTEDARAKTWDSSASSDLEKDVQRGIEIISDFVKGSCANNSAMKKKLIRRVVEKLITKNYNDDVRTADLASNVPWVPSRPANPVASGRETRRSLSRSKVPCEFSSRSEKSGSTNASSECFIPKPAASSTFLPNSFREVSGAQGKQSHSSTSEISFEKSSKLHGKHTNPMELKAQSIQKASLPLNLSEESIKSSERGNWREPATRSERIIEEKRKLMNKSKDKTESSSEQSDAVTLVQYLNMERENQLFWIRSEIQHLSNLRELLEKQEELKRGMKGLNLKKNKSSAKSILRDKNRESEGTYKDEAASKTVSQTSSSKEKSRHAVKPDRRPSLSVWLEESLTGQNDNQSAQSEAGMEDWTSHNYNKENETSLKSCINRKSKHSKRMERKMQSVENNASEIYDEVEGRSFRRAAKEENKNKPPPTPHWPNGVNRPDDCSLVTTEGLKKKNAQTETLDSVGVQTTESVQQLPIVHPSWFNKPVAKCRCRCRGMCKCCAGEEEQKKEPVGYFITFEPSPRERDEPAGAAKPLEEVRIPIPVSEPKQKNAKQRTDGEVRERERLLREPEGRNENDREERRQRAGADCGRTGSETDSDGQGIPINGGPIYKGATGMLQYCLLRNRPDYVSRAEDRRQCIGQMQYLRELRDQSKRRLLSLSEPLVPPPLQPEVQPPMPRVRVFSQQTMRRQTEKKYRQLAEVQRRQQDTKRKQGYRTNRLMAEIFNRKLQKRVLKGETNLSNSLTVLSSV